MASWDPGETAATVRAATRPPGVRQELCPPAQAQPRLHSTRKNRKSHESLQTPFAGPRDGGTERC